MRFGFVLAIAFAAAACGSEIGDECAVSSDCSPNGNRQCDNTVKGGYCTIPGCDFSTCPEEAVCVRFFTGSFNTVCDSKDDCTPDELCSIAGRCVSRSSEIRYCMRKCSSNGDCRDGYECRDLSLMMQHGGEPVLAPGVPVDERAPKFCAASPG